MQRPYDRKSERDLLYLYYHYGLLLLEEEQMEQAFFCFEEGNYLAKKLKLSYWKSQLAYARGLLELKGEDANPTKAKRYFKEAERYAERGPYADLLSRIRAQRAGCGDDDDSKSAGPDSKSAGLDSKSAARNRDKSHL